MDVTTRDQLFFEELWGYYAQYGRHDLPWRRSVQHERFDPYKILVSELMLQQTQVARVVPKYNNFLERFPDVFSLARAEQGDVLRVWQGLGYNRRAKFLHQASCVIARDYQGIFPQDITELVKLPGVGKNTAGALAVYAWDVPVVFVETNIRTVVIHHFFADQADIPDTDIITVMERLVKTVLAASESPRNFYWAMMDYGTHIKQTVGNLNKLSNTYTKQSKFHGSQRQLRGALLRELAGGVKTHSMLSNKLSDDRLDVVLADLENEGLIRRHGDDFSL